MAYILLVVCSCWSKSYKGGRCYVLWRSLNLAHDFLITIHSLNKINYYFYYCIDYYIFYIVLICYLYYCTWFLSWTKCHVRMCSALVIYLNFRDLKSIIVGYFIPIYYTVLPPWFISLLISNPHLEAGYND